MTTLPSSLEGRAMLALFRTGCPAPSRELPVGSYRLDLAWPALKIGIETDGFYHRLPERALSDAHRDSWLREQGWLIFRVHDVDDDEVFEQMLGRVADVVRALDGAPS